MIDPEKPVQSPQQFFGQKAVLRRIFSRIGAERPQSVAVIGGIKSGKTSLLNCIAHETIRREYLDQGDRYLFCRADSAQELFSDARSFLTGVQRLLGGELSEQGNHYNRLQRFVEELHNRGRRLIFLLDDFHLITSNSSFPLEFFSFLRSLANNYNLAYVTTSFLELQKLCVIKDIEESPFFNIFTNLSLKPLSPEEGVELLSALTGRQAAEVQELVKWSGCFPYVLKLIARALLAGGGQPGRLDAEKALLPVLSPYFQQVISILPPEALNPLKSLARNREPDPREVHMLRPLIKQGFLREERDSVSVFAPAFTAYLRKSLSKKLLQGRN
jgi:hypothetical protein